MKKSVNAISVFFLLAFLCHVTFSPGLAAENSPAENFIRVGDYEVSADLISFQADTEENARSAAAQYGLNVELVLSALSRNTGKFCGYFKRQPDNRLSVTEIISGLKAHRSILYAGYSYRMTIHKTPNDTDFSKLWGMHNTGQTSGTPDSDIDAPEAWDMSTGSDKVVVAVIDTGVNYTHEDLAANMWVNPDEIAGNNKDDDGNGYIDDIHGINVIKNNGDPKDDHNHGSHCSGTIGGVGNNGKGVAGVNWTVRIMGLKFLNGAGSGEDAHAVVCLDYVIDQLDKGQKIACTSNSYGGGDFDQNFEDAINVAGQKGCLFIAAAGNDTSNNDTKPVYPCNYDSPYILSIAALDHKDALASFSNWGAKTVELGAPGVNIYSCDKSGGYMQMSGTSMATPHVAGAVGLLASVYPNCTALELKSRICDFTDPVSALSGKSITGGRLNINNSIRSGCIVKASFIFSKLSDRNFKFTDTTLVNGCNLKSWYWTFGDNQTSSLQNPSHTYASDNYYTVTLKATSNDGTANEYSRKIWAGPNQTPVADFTYESGAQFRVDFTDTSTDDSGIKSWYWEFGDGNTSTETNPTHIYNYPDSYQVKLTVTDTNNTTNSVTKTVVVPLIYCSSKSENATVVGIIKFQLGSFSNSSGRSNYSDFTDKTIDLQTGQNYSMTITTDSTFWSAYCRVWIDFNRNGSFSDSGEKVLEKYGKETISQSFTVPGSAAIHKKLGIRVSMQVNNYRGECESGGWGEVEDYTVVLNGLVNDPPVADFSYTTNQLTVNFDNSSFDPDGTISANLWNFGDNTSSTETDPIHIYAKEGTYTVTLKVTDNQNATDQISKTVTVKDDPNLPVDHLIGTFPSVGGIWKRDSNTGDWLKLSKQEADMVRVGDVDGNGKDDSALFFDTDNKMWIRYDDGTWDEIAANAASLICYDLGDMNNDNQADLIGSWTTGLWWRNSANGLWTKLSNMSPTFIATGDFNGDNKTDMVGLFPSLKEIWILYNNGTWVKISKQINIKDLRTGDMNKDGKDEIVGSWDIGVWAMDVNSGVWTRHHAQTADQIAVGDVDGDGIDDIVGIWPSIPGLWVKYIGSAQWEKLSNLIPITIDLGNI